MFESRVILDGSQTFIIFTVVRVLFESRVILDGSQTRSPVVIEVTTFESRVILDGSQTNKNTKLKNRKVWESCYFRW